MSLFVKNNVAIAGIAGTHLPGDAVLSRKAKRFPVRLPTIFRWKDEQGAMRQEAGFTRDISTSGLFVYSAIAPPVDAALELDVLILLPVQKQGTHLRGSGRVVRVEGRGEHAGFAAISDFGLDSSAVRKPIVQ